jgi:phytoene/squalene synthetase
VRAGYCLLQHLDDVADGDRDVGVDPGAYLAQVVDEIARERFSRSSIPSVLAAHVVPELRARACGGTDPLRDLQDLIRILAFDRERAARGLVLPEAELRAHHRRTFELSLGLTLVTAESDLTPKDAEALIDALCWCSPMRDLSEDLERGLINVPAEVLAAAGIAGRPGRETASHPALRPWIRSELARGTAAIDAFERSLPRLAGRRGATALVLLHRALQSFARRYARALP